MTQNARRFSLSEENFEDLKESLEGSGGYEQEGHGVSE
jgi:hypothetical protein